MSTQPIAGVTEIRFPKALVNAFLLDADVPTLIDTGTPGGSRRIMAAITAATVPVGATVRVLLTHRHADHAGNAALLHRTISAEVHVSPDDAPYVVQAREQPRPQPATPLGRAMVPYVKHALPWTLEPVDAQATLVDGARVGPFLVIASPGHTAGHVSLFWEERGILFAGDAAANITRVGPHPAADDPDRARESFRRLTELDIRAACFGHGKTLPSGARERFQACLPM